MPEQLPRIKVLTTGGTIAATPAGGLGYRAGALPAQRLFDAIPELAQRAHIEVQAIADVGSQDVDHAFWCSLQQHVQASVDDPNVDAVVITHGTDTLEETAFILHLTVSTTKPVVLTGAMRPPHVVGADGPANLLAAIVVAGHRTLAGVHVVMNESVFDPVQVQKQRAEGLEAFAGRNAAPVARLIHDVLHLYVDPHAVCPLRARFVHTSLAQLPFVPVVYVHPGMDPRTFDTLLQLDCAAVVVAGVGNGNAPAYVWSRLQHAAAEGLTVVRSTRCAGGHVLPNVEVNDAQYGFIAAGGFSPQKAAILLQLGLANRLNRGEIQNIFLAI